MNDMTRLREASPHQRTRALLEAGRRDAPRPGAAQRALIALATSAAAGGVTASAGAAGSASAVAPSLAPMIAKWLALGLVSGGLATAGTLAVQSTSSRRPAIVSVAAAPFAPSPSVRAPEPSVPVPEQARSTTEAAAPVRAAPSPKPRPSAPAKAATSDGGKLAREVQSIDTARGALAAGDTVRALTELDGYERLVETHTLDREAAVLRIEALLARGERERARSLYERYVERYPGDAYTARLRARWGSIAE
jgi:hypothetical protein